MPDAKRELRAVLYGLLVLFFIISATYRVFDISARVSELRRGAEHVQDPFDIDLPEWEVQRVESGAAHAGLQPGDTIRAINAAGAPQHDDMTLVVVRRL